MEETFLFLSDHDEAKMIVITHYSLGYKVCKKHVLYINNHTKETKL